MKQLTYIETTTVPHIGSVEIYRFKQPPYSYIMKHRRVFSVDDPSLDTYLRNLGAVAGELSHKNIAQIHYYKNNIRKFVVKQSSTCVGKARRSRPTATIMPSHSRRSSAKEGRMILDSPRTKFGMYLSAYFKYLSLSADTSITSAPTSPRTSP